MSLLVQISDPHFGTEQPLVMAALFALLDAQRPDVAVLSGDITQRARRHEFAKAKRFVERLGAPSILVVPGNHDIPLFNPIARLFYPYANFCRVFGATLEPEHASESLLVLCVNTTRPGRHTDGEVSDEQIERVARRLQRASPGQLRIVVTHQPAHVVRAQDVHNLLHGHARAVRAWSEAGVDLVMGGHIHVPYVVRLPLELAPRAAWIVQAGTAVSRRVRAGFPNSIHLVRHASDSTVCHIERWDYAAGANAFQCVERLALDLERSAVARGLSA